MHIIKNTSDMGARHYKHIHYGCTILALHLRMPPKVPGVPCAGDVAISRRAHPGARAQAARRGRGVRSASRGTREPVVELFGRREQWVLQFFVAAPRFPYVCRRPHTVVFLALAELRRVLGYQEQNERTAGRPCAGSSSSRSRSSARARSGCSRCSSSCRRSSSTRRRTTSTGPRGNRLATECLSCAALVRKFPRGFDVFKFVQSVFSGCSIGE